jgi:hypothetical protein
LGFQGRDLGDGIKETEALEREKPSENQNTE